MQINHDLARNIPKTLQYANIALTIKNNWRDIHPTFRSTSD